jgi:hypothetical protein
MVAATPSRVPGRVAVLVASFGVVGPIISWLCLGAYVLLVSQQSDLANYGSPLWTAIDATLVALSLTMTLIVLALVPAWLFSCALNFAVWVAVRGSDPPDRGPRIALALNLLGPVSWMVEVAMFVGGMFWLLQGVRL